MTLGSRDAAWSKSSDAGEGKVMPPVRRPPRSWADHRILGQEHAAVVRVRAGDAFSLRTSLRTEQSAKQCCCVVPRRGSGPDGPQRYRRSRDEASARPGALIAAAPINTVAAVHRGPIFEEIVQLMQDRKVDTLLAGAAYFRASVAPRRAMFAEPVVRRAPVSPRDLPWMDCPDVFARQWSGDGPVRL
ncbi:hypothetical protein [Streptomyces sp. 142MFCol3.1]|uniref:hypothetical protein n=1 Tax=Streptomyces sp. 142MFCol3.1 TaxID=1172179 RepID=UPI001319BC95|nr:hypothetical protein [Streptomyces sp. 142MFCol3.1]